MTPSCFAQCPKCGYELGATHADRGRCPECGGAFSWTEVVSRHCATVSFSLALIGVGILAAKLADAVGMSFSFLPHAKGGEQATHTVQVSNGYAAARQLSLLPMVAAAYGVAVLALATAKGAFRRWWPALAAVIFVLAMLSKDWFTNLRKFGTDDWSIYAPWYWAMEEALRWSEGALVLAIALLLGRVVAAAAMGRLSNAVRALLLVACALLGMLLSARGISWYIELQREPPPDETPWSGTTLRWLDATYPILRWVAWSSLGLFALHVRAIWNACTPAQAIRT